MNHFDKNPINILERRLLQFSAIEHGEIIGWGVGGGGGGSGAEDPLILRYIESKDRARIFFP